MNKSDLIKRVANETGLTKSKASEVVDCIISSVQESLQNGEKVTLVGFGTFETYEKKGRLGRNPRNGDLIDIPSKKVAKFKPGAELSKNMNA